jgi:hypothetical protein
MSARRVEGHLHPPPAMWRGDVPKKTTAVKRAASVLIVTAVLLPFGRQAAAAPKCGATRRPTTDLSYTTRVIKLRLSFPLAGCRGGDSIFAVTYAARRTDALTEREQFGFEGCAGSGLRRCSVVVRMAHPAAEAAKYLFRVVFPRASGAKGVYRRSATCVSGVIMTTCEAGVAM